MWKLVISATLLVTFFSISNVTGDDDGTSTKEATPDGVNLDALLMECNETFRIEMKYLIALNDSGSFPDETDRTPKCFLRCVLEKSGVASAEGAYDAARTSVVFAGMRGEDDVQKIAEGCTDRQEACKCERAYKYMKCLLEAEIKNQQVTKCGSMD